MNRRPSPNGAERPARGWWVTAIVLAGLAAVFVGVGMHGSSTGKDQPAATPAATVPAPASVPAPTKPSPAAPSQAAPSTAAPVSLRIPAINVATTVIPLGLNDDKTVEVPGNPDEAGWFRLGPPPGQPGSAVILGHVDSMQGPAVFYELRYLEPGDRIRVRLSDETVARFQVTSVATYPNDDFPARRVYAGDPGRPTLALVTCGGDYDAHAGGYQSNVVVYTALVRDKHAAT